MASLPKYPRAAIVLTIVAALLGLLGRGPLAKGTIKNGTLQVRFEQVLRSKTPAVAEIRVSESSYGGDVLRLRFE